MLIAAYVLILPVFFKQTKQSDIDVNEVNLSLGRERLAELDADLAAGKLDQANYQTLKNELEMNLLSTVDLNAVNAQATASSNPFMLWLVIALIPLISLGVYLQTGSQLALDDVARADFLAQQEQAQEPDIEAMVDQLAERLAIYPEDGEGWWMLGRSYLVMGRLADAEQAFAKALPLQDANADLLADYADTIGRLNNSDLTGRAKAFIRRALSLDPNQQKARWLSGVLAFQEGRYAEVTDLMQPLLQQTEQGSEINRSIQELIKESQLRAKTGTVNSQIAVTPAAVSAEHKIQLTVNLSDELQSQVNPDDVLFVFARATQGPPMPLAAQKLQVSDLPLSITLDDSMAMRPGMGISSQASVSVVARVSKGGNPIAAAGDLQGQVENIPTENADPVSITIDTILP